MKTETYSNEAKVKSDLTLHTTTTNALLKASLNFLIAVVICVIANLALRIDFVLLGNSIGEISVTEFTEQFMLVIAAGCFFYLANAQPKLRHAAVLIGSFFLVMIIRENDAFFDHINHGFWVYPALVTTIAALFYATKNGKNTLEQLALIVESKHMNLLIVGMALLLVYSRLFGMGGFWKEVMGQDYVRLVKDIAEEGTELLAYSIIAFASFKVARTFRVKR